MSPRLLVACVALSWGAALAAQQSGIGRPADPAPQAAQRRVDYSRDIKPLLEARCGECHNGTKRKGGLALETYVDILDGGKDGPIVQPGHSAGSMLLERLTGAGDEDQMPKDEPPLAAAEIALIARWIDEGVRETPAGPPAPAPWVAPLTLAHPTVPAAAWPDWQSPADRLVADYLRRHGQARPALIDDARFARRVHLDVWGLLPTPEQLQAFLDDPARDKRARLVRTLLADGDRYAEHWMSFWNDLLRNEDGVTYFSEDAGRQSITPWLFPALRDNLPYDRFVAALIDPAKDDDPQGFVTGVNWRGETSAAVTPWMQAAQNTSQVFLGVNLKCASCHDSFVNKWKLKDAYGLAAYFSPDDSLQMFRCDLPQDKHTGPGFIFPGFARTPPIGLAGRSPRRRGRDLHRPAKLGRLPRTLVNRVWQRLMGRGIVGTVDEMDGEPWSPALLDWLAADFAGHQYDIKHLVETIVTSRAYQMAAVRREGEPPARGYVFRGPEVRRLSAEQFADAIGSITGEWSVAAPPPTPAPRPTPRPQPGAEPGGEAGSAAPAAVAADVGRDRGARVAGALVDPDPRPRPPDPRSDHLDSRDRRDDAAGAGADQRRGAVALAGARSAAHGRPAAARSDQPLHAHRGRPERRAERLRHRRIGRDAPLAGRRGLRLERPRGAAAGVGRRRADWPGGRDTALVADAGRRHAAPRRRPAARAGRARRRDPRRQPVGTGLRRRRTGLHPLPRRHRRRERARRHRIHPQPGAALLRLRRRPESGSHAAGDTRHAAAPAGAAHDRRRRRRSRLPPRPRTFAEAGRTVPGRVGAAHGERRQSAIARTAWPIYSGPY